MKTLLYVEGRGSYYDIHMLIKSLTSKFPEINEPEELGWKKSNSLKSDDSDETFNFNVLYGIQWPYEVESEATTSFQNLPKIANEFCKDLDIEDLCIEVFLNKWIGGDHHSVFIS